MRRAWLTSLVGPKQSRTRAPAGQLYSAASAVFLVEILKTCISVSVALTNITAELQLAGGPGDHRAEAEKREQVRLAGFSPKRELTAQLAVAALSKLASDVFRSVSLAEPFEL